MTYEQCVEELYNIPLFGQKSTLEELSIFLKCINSPHKSLKFIHVAGTNGKGSMCAMLASIYQEAGYRVGMFTSPHLIHVNERIRVNNQNISNDNLIRIYEALGVLLKNQTTEFILNPTYFETLFIMALQYFMEEAVDIVLLETGIGGLKDCTNVIESPLASIITLVDYDHVEILGHDIKSIAKEKAGIIKSGSPVIYLQQSQVVNQIIEREAKKNHALSIGISDSFYKIHKKAIKNIDFSVKYKYYDYMGLTLKTSADYQVAYATMAIVTIHELLHILPVDDAHIRSGLEGFKWEGRMEIYDHLVLDGAHNVSGIQAFISNVQRLFPDKMVIIIFGSMKTKDYQGMMRELLHLEHLKKMILVPLHGSRGCDIKTLEILIKELQTSQNTATELIDSVDDARRKHIINSIIIEESVEVAFNKYRVVESNEVLCCIGSLHLIGDIKRLMGGNKND